jgi:hypothetical protein
MKLASIFAGLMVTVLTLTAWAGDVPASAPSLDSGFGMLYNLDFDRAHAEFKSWEKQHPDDPRGPVSDAAGLLFSELHRLGVLESQFYEEDRKFEARKKLAPDPGVRDRFDAQIAVAESRAEALLAKNPKDPNALFAMTLSFGLKADYAALIDKSNLASLRYTRESTDWAERLLAVDPDNYDAHLASGISRYIVGSMSAPMRWILKLGGVSGDKQAGIAELQLTADRGRYLAPFAKILLAIAYVREHDKERARQVLASLRDQFPGNPLFPREIARLDAGTH